MRTFSLLHFLKDPRGRLAVWREPHQTPMPLHRHDYVEIAIILSGSGLHRASGFRQRLERGDVLVITPNRLHAYEETMNLNLVNLMIHQRLLTRLGRDLRDTPGYEALFLSEGRQRGPRTFSSYLRLGGEELAQVNDWISLLERETERYRRDGHLLAESYLTLIIGLLCRQYRQMMRHERATPGDVSRLLSWIEQHLSEPITVADLAEQARMSLRTFHRFFHKVVGTTPTVYLVRTRIERAAERLRRGSPQDRITEVAYDCGFNDPAYFSRCFSREKGESPLAYQRRVHGKG